MSVLSCLLLNRQTLLSRSNVVRPFFPQILTAYYRHSTEIDYVELYKVEQAQTFLGREEKCEDTKS